MIHKRCTEGGDLHCPKGHTQQYADDGSSTAICGICGQPLYAAKLGVPWELAPQHLIHEEEELDYISAERATHKSDAPLRGEEGQ